MDGDVAQFALGKSIWAQLWREIHGEPPPLADDTQLLSRILVETLPPLPPYEIGKAPMRTETPAPGGATPAGEGPPTPACEPGHRADPAGGSGHRPNDPPG